MTIAEQLAAQIEDLDCEAAWDLILASGQLADGAGYVGVPCTIAGQTIYADDETVFFTDGSALKCAEPFGDEPGEDVDKVVSVYADPADAEEAGVAARSRTFSVKMPARVKIVCQMGGDNAHERLCKLNLSGFKVVDGEGNEVEGAKVVFERGLAEVRETTLSAF